MFHKSARAEAELDKVEKFSTTRSIVAPRADSLPTRDLDIKKRAYVTHACIWAKRHCLVPQTEHVTVGIRNRKLSMYSRVVFAIEPYLRCGWPLADWPFGPSFGCIGPFSWWLMLVLFQKDELLCSAASVSVPRYSELNHSFRPPKSAVTASTASFHFHAPETCLRLLQSHSIKDMSHIEHCLHPVELAVLFHESVVRLELHRYRKTLLATYD